MKRFVWLDGRCRRAYLLRYFGEAKASRPDACCNTCHPRPLPAGLTVNTTKGTRQKRAVARPAAVVAPSAPPHPAAAALMECLRQWRRGKATAMGVPAYVVFGDKDLTSIAAAAPRTLEELAACRGVGPVKLDQYGAEVLAVIEAVRAHR